MLLEQLRNSISAAFISLTHIQPSATNVFNWRRTCVQVFLLNFKQARIAFDVLVVAHAVERIFALKLRPFAPLP